MNHLTIEDLEKGNCGTPCGHSEKSKTSLSQPLVISFIDLFFNGILDNLQIIKEDGYILVCSGESNLTKFIITTDEFNKFTSISDEFRNKIIKDVIYYAKCSKNDLKNIENKIKVVHHPKIICRLFLHLVSEYGGSLRCEYLNNGKVDLESE